VRLRSLLIVGALLAIAAFTAALPAPTSAADTSVDEARAELDVARVMVDEAVRQYADGDAKAAYLTARNAYLDHFEYVEVPLRVRDEALTLALEEDFAGLRNQIEDGAPLATVRATAAEVQAGLDDVERALSEPGIAAPLIATAFSFTLLFREGVEAVLIVAAVLAYLEASRNRAYRRPVLLGVATALVATVATYFLIGAVFQLAPAQRELMEALVALAAVAVLFYVSFWLLSKVDHRRWMEFVKARVWAATATGSMVALFGVGFTAVYREGVETALFYQALLGFSRGLEAFVVLGIAVAAAALAVVAWLVFRAGRRIPVRLFLGVAVVVLIVMSIAFAGNTVRAFQQAALLPVTFLESLPRLPIFLADLTGWHPTLETIVAQFVLAVIYVAGAIWLFVIVPRRAVRASGPEPTGAPS
jgi:high-affinity iron transporter